MATFLHTLTDLNVAFFIIRHFVVELYYRVFLKCLNDRHSDGNKTVESVMASACSEQSPDNDDRLLECAICMDNFVDPCLLPCSHTFCRPCLVRHYQSSRCSTAAQGADDNEVINCPACRQTWPLPSLISVNQSPSSATDEYQFRRASVNESVPHPSCITVEVNSIVF